MNHPDPWLARLRLLAGIPILAWEVYQGRHSSWWAIIIAIWLLGGPIEDIVKFLTAGRLSIQVRKSGGEDD